MTQNIDVPEVALAIGAHPDDIDFHCSATLAKWAARGCEVHYLVMTDGSKGTWDSHENRENLIALRRFEQREAYMIVTGSDMVIAEQRTHFLPYVDGELEITNKEISAVCAIIRQIQPQVILAHDPWKRYRLHPDHRKTGFIVTDAIVAARDPLFYPEQKWPHFRPKLLMLFEADEIDHGEDISQYEEIKISALLKHKSQLLSTMGIDISATEDVYREKLSAFETDIENKHIRAGEVFNLTKAESYKLMTNL
ncbi:MAG: PIG-L family deacetylase [Firmicutes bacterium]|jgi:LmbE family N-acetylglucosaminyl deacetylase|nr:PIG-L family deacetylase [Bacillota bacterium]